MIWITHITFGLLMGIVFIDYVKIDPLVYFTIIVFTSLMPDLDHSESKLGKKVFFSGFIQSVFGHRGLLHSPLFLVALGGIGYMFLPLSIVMTFVIGYGSHILIDMFTMSGIRIFHPLSDFKIKGFIRTNSVFEYFLIFLLMCFIVYLA